VVKLDEKRWRVSGATRIDDFQRECPELGEVQQVETMGGLLVHLIETVPTPGESAVFRGLKLTARVTDERRVRELLVERTK
jgi:CBS domain containing-hemolysin-like protein